MQHAFRALRFLLLGVLVSAMCGLPVVAQPADPSAAAQQSAPAQPTVAEAQAPAGELPLVTPASGEPFRAKLAGAVDQPSWQLQFVADDAKRDVEVKDLALFGNFVRPGSGVLVVLAGGDVVVVDAFGIVEDKLAANSPLAGNFALPLRLVAGVLLQTPADRAKTDLLIDRMLALTGEVDRVVLENGDELTGTITAFDGATLRLKSGETNVDLPLAKLATILFNPILIDKPSASGMRTLVGLPDGSHVTATSLVADDKTSRLKLLGGVEIAVSTTSIVALQPLGGNVVYLSDLKPASYRHIPFLEMSWPYGADRSVQETMLLAGGKLYLKGLGMHSPSRITYELDEPFKRFDAEVAVDAEAGHRGSVIFRVFADDGSGAWQERAKSEIVRGGEPPMPLSADLSGAKRISLLVDFADRGDERDHADWLNARLVR